MKQALIDVLKVIDDDKVSIVKQLHYADMVKGDIFWISGAWCEFSNCWKERTLFHITFLKNGNPQYHTVRQNTFLVKIG